MILIYYGAISAGENAVVNGVYGDIGVVAK